VSSYSIDRERISVSAVLRQKLPCMAIHRLQVEEKVAT
jgi:hypothetical protein